METMSALQQLGLLDLTPHPALHPNGPEITWVSQFLLLQLERNRHPFMTNKIHVQFGTNFGSATSKMHRTAIFCIIFLCCVCESNVKPFGNILVLLWKYKNIILCLCMYICMSKFLLKN